MTETQRRIRAYKRALPHMKERVIAVALLLAMSVSMMSSATFAWITLSTNPEASCLATTIVANGNLEIALSDTDGAEPEESAVGDGGQNVALSNLTWGNLVNLADISYGLDHLVLRPATRNDQDLLNSPVNAVIYGADGRVVDYTTDFAYSNYDATSGKYLVPTKEITNEEGKKEKVNTTHYGVRAVSSVTYEDITGNAFLVTSIDQINKRFVEAQGLFQSIYQSDDYMGTVGYLVGKHVEYVLGDADVLVEKYQVENTKKIADVFYNAMYAAGDVIVKLINLHQYLSLDDDTASTYHEYTFNEVFAVNYTLGSGANFTSNNLNNALLNKYVKDEFGNDMITAITTYRRAWVNTVNFCNGMNEANEKSQVYWAADMMSDVNLLCNMDTATLNGLTPAQLQADMINQALAIIRADEDDHVAVLHNGALVDADQLLDGNLKVNAGKVSVTVVIPADIKQKIKDKLGSLGGIAAAFVPDKLTLKPEISTSAEPPALLVTDYQTANQRASGGSSLKGVATAADTYAMAIDFWVRTNVKNSLLILEGDLQTEEIVLKDAEGNPVLDDNGQEQTATVVVGYSGVNRVWDELDDPTTDAGYQIYQSGGISMTQGSGSCYIFYADNPEQQSQSLNMLRAMRVAFINDAGELLNVAEMDVANAVQDGGRVIVPLQLGRLSEVTLEDGSILSDEEGEPITRYIQALNQNEPQRITALVYLDGGILTNSEVLEAGTIKGQLNIQFGTTEMHMEPQVDGELIQSYYTIDFAQKSYGFDGYDPDNCTIELKMMLEGNNPTTVKGNFLSIINEHQGARQEEFTMELGEDGWWTANVSFPGPGNYELRSIKLDGVDVALTPDDPETTSVVEGNVVRVEIKGVAITSLNCTGKWPSGKASHQVKTADTYYHQPMSLRIGSQSTHTIRGVFIGDNGQNVSVNFAHQDSGLYEGTAVFNSSSTYRLTYLEIDGTVTPLPESMYKTITLQLGLRAYVTIGTPVLETGEVNEDILKNVVFDADTGWSFVYTCEEPVKMPVDVMIIDDQNKMLSDLEGLKLFYSAPGATELWPDTNLEPTVNGGYTGEFVNFNRSGVYQFRYVFLGDGNYITAAASAPTITSIPPDIMEYVEQEAYEPLTYEWGADRNLYVTLKNATAAQLFAELTRYNADGTVAETVPVGPIMANTTDVDKVSTFVVRVPSDGDWKLTGLEAAIVFAKTEEYPDGKFFSGAPIYGDDNTTVEGYDRVDLTDAVLADQIGSYFLTQIDVAVNNAPKSFDSDFMEGKEFNDMTIAVNNQGRPLAEVLEEVKTKFSREDIDTNVTVGMQYTWTKNSNYTYPETNLPDHDFGSTNLTLNDKNLYPMGNMNFLLAGDYVPTFTLNVDGNDYKAADLGLSTEMYKALTDTVRVGWKTPDVTITAVTPSPNVAYSVDLKSGNEMTDVLSDVRESGNWFKTTYTYDLTVNSNHIPAAQNSEYITRVSGNMKEAWVYFKCIHTGVGKYVDDGSYDVYVGFIGSPAYKYHNYESNNGASVPSATLTLSSMGKASSVKLQFTAEGNGDVRMYTEYSLDNNTNQTGWTNDSNKTDTYVWNLDAEGKFTTKTCKRFIGYVDNNNNRTGNDAKTPAGKLTATHLTMTYNGGEYKIPLTSSIIIHNDY